MSDAVRSEMVSSLKPRVTVSATHVVCVRVLGSPDPVRVLRADGGLVRALAEWMLVERIYSATEGGYWSPGSHYGYYTPADAERIVEWCQAHGAELVALEDQQ